MTRDEQIAAVRDEMRQWLGVGGLFNPIETSVLRRDGSNAIIDWMTTLDAVLKTTDTRKETQ